MLNYVQVGNIGNRGPVFQVKDLLEKKHLIEKLPDHLKERIKKPGERENDDDILDLDTIMIGNERKLIAKLEVFWYIPSDEDMDIYLENELDDGRYYYVEIGSSTLGLSSFSYYKLDDNIDPKGYHTIWLLVDEISKY